MDTCKTFLLIVCIHVNLFAFSTHILSGEIHIKVIDCAEGTVEITVVGYVDGTSGVSFGTNSNLRFGDGNSLIPSPAEFESTYLENGVTKVAFTTEYTYDLRGLMRISYTENNRSGGIQNMEDYNVFYIESGVNLSPGICATSPTELLSTPVDFACKGVAFYHNTAAYSPEADSLSVELFTPRKSSTDHVDDYISPLEFSAQDENENEPGIFTIDSTGTLIWDAPAITGHFVMAIKITSWVNINGEWQVRQYTVRDMSVIVRECSPNNRPELHVPEDLCVEAGEEINVKITGVDFDSDDLMIEGFSELFELEKTALPEEHGIWQSGQFPTDSAEYNFRWQTSCTDIRSRPYRIVFKIRDRNAAREVLSVTFKTWEITVIPPKPEWENSHYNFEDNTISLSRRNYPCESVVDSISLWRNVGGGNNFRQNCFERLNQNVYTKIASPETDEMQFIDTNPIPGAKLCYKLVYYIQNVESDEIEAVSSDICLGPVIIDSPVLKEVSVLETDTQSGKIQISWMPPLEISKEFFGTEYRYEILRSFSLDGADPEPIAVVKDTFLIDEGLNTYDSTFSYSIVLYSENATSVSPDVPIDTATSASQVRLEIESDTESIRINWKYNTPWTNTSADYPYHYIYRKEEGTSDEDFELINRVNAVQEGLTYRDASDLQTGIRYCYRVLTHGSYDNPLIPHPFPNYSQTACAYLYDTIPPSQPVLYSQSDCNDISAGQLCEMDSYQNTINWTRSEEASPETIYRIYFSKNNGEVEMVGTTTDTTFTHSGLNEFMGCYRVQAIDIFGNESKLSNEVCVDNCPGYFLPNVITLSSKDGCNDLFMANGGGETNCGEPTLECSRFVKNVNFKVFNRWGGEVFSLNSGNEDNVYIKWDGRNHRGEELSKGVYYYSAEVQFRVLDEFDSFKTYKGTIQIL